MRCDTKSCRIYIYGYLDMLFCHIDIVAQFLLNFLYKLKINDMEFIKDLEELLKKADPKDIKHLFGTAYVAAMFMYATDKVVALMKD